MSTIEKMWWWIKDLYGMPLAEATGGDVLLMILIPIFATVVLIAAWAAGE